MRSRIIGAAAVALTAGACAVSFPDYPAGLDAVGYVIPGNGIVYDSTTHLNWQQAVPAQSYTWSAAVSYCSSNTAGLPGGPWRLPTMAELETIVDEGQQEPPRVNPTAFPGVNGTPSWRFWTSSPVPGSPSHAWGVDFYAGAIIGDVVTAAYSVRCVR